MAEQMAAALGQFATARARQNCIARDRRPQACLAPGQNEQTGDHLRGRPVYAGHEGASTMDKRHTYSIRLDWTGNEGSGTSSYRAYSRSHELSAPGKHAIAGSSE